MATDPRADALSTLARFQVTDASVGDTLTRIAELTLTAVPTAAIAGMTMLDDDGRPTTAVYTDHQSPEIDEAQYRDGHGPCLDAWRGGRVVSVPSVRAAAREYPGFAEACDRHGVASTLSLPMISGGTSMGAMNLYAFTEGSFDEDDIVHGVDLAEAAASVLANVSAYWTAFEMSQQLSEAMESRAVIEQAKGMLMARTPGLSADDAFTVLRQASQRENVKLREIAQRIVERRSPATSGELAD
jgi:transcriptional regulator with GAF, ATPase, and Fis domain